MRSFVTSVSGLRPSSDPVRFCAWCASRFLCASRIAASIQRRPLRSRASPAFTLSPRPACRRLMKSFRLATPLPPPRPPRSPIHVANPPLTTTSCGRWTCSQHAAKGPIPGSCEVRSSSGPRSPILAIGPRQPVSSRPPPTSTALVGSLGLLC